MYESKFKTGFTISEVLITIGIIGIVAAMTLPSIIADSRKEATAAKLTSIYPSSSPRQPLDSVAPTTIASA